MKASEGPSPRAIAASTSREVVTWMKSEILWVESHSPPGRCSTKPRSVCTGPPRSTGCAAVVGCVASSFICASTSPSFISSGLLSTMPSAPLSLCSQIRVTLCAKLPSASEGIATSKLLASEVVWLMAEVWGRSATLSRVGCAAGVGADRPGTELAAGKLPLVGETHRAVVACQGRREWLERAGEPQYLQRRLVDLGMAARALDRGLTQAAVGAQRHLDDGTSGEIGPARGRREIEGADTLHLAAPGVEVGREG